jgi:glycosyltransferase involved in cell wall biosynthesis
MPWRTPQPNKKLMRILVSGYACSPGRGSEQGVGWHRIRQLARFHEVWGITRVKNRESIEAAIARERIPNVHFVYHDLPPWARFWKKGRRGIHLYYYLWQLTAYLKARKLHQQVAFDQVHHVTFCNYWMPSFMALLPVPFQWGPVGGGEAPPLSFWSCYSTRGKVFEFLRIAAQRLGEMDPFLRATARRAAVALATTDRTAERLKILGCREVLVYSEAGLPQEEIERLAAIPIRTGELFRLVSLGDLLHLKGFELGLRAFAQFQKQFPQSEYWLMGEGPERQRLRKIARKLGVEKSVKFWGRIPRAEVLQKLELCDVLVHPSLHDSGGWVCLEAMAAGRPVICLDIGGPGLQVTAETGVKVKAISPKQAIDEMAAAMAQLAQNPELKNRMGEAGRARVSEIFAWEKKGEWLRDLSLRIERVDSRSVLAEGIENAR